MKIEQGEVFAISTKIGFGFFQFISTSNLGIEIIRVLETVKQSNKISQDDVNITERFTLHFVVKAALRKAVIEKVGMFKIPETYTIPAKGREQHIVRGEFIGWHIIDQKTLRRELKKELTSKEVLIPPYGYPNDTLLKNYIENNFRLENWK